MFDAPIEINGTQYFIPRWFQNKEIKSQFDVVVVATSDMDWMVMRETAKAVKVTQSGHFGRIELWVPKSILLTKEEAEEDIRKDNEREKLIEEYDEYLHQTAKDASVKVGNLKRWEKIIDKLTKFGVEVMSFKDFKASAATA